MMRPDWFRAIDSELLSWIGPWTSRLALGFGGAQEALRALVASLTLAHDFSLLLAGAMRPVTNVSASPAK